MKTQINNIQKETITIEKEVYKNKCPKCDKEIIGTSEDQVIYNLMIHMLTHKENNKNDK